MCGESIRNGVTNDNRAIFHFRHARTIDSRRHKMVSVATGTKRLHLQIYIVLA